MNYGAIPHDLSKYITGLPLRTEIIMTHALFNSEIDGIPCMQYIKLIYDLRDYVPGFTKAKVVLSIVRYIISSTPGSKNECFCFFIVVSICIWLLKK